MALSSTCARITALGRRPGPRLHLRALRRRHRPRTRRHGLRRRRRQGSVGSGRRDCWPRSRRGRCPRPGRRSPRGSRRRRAALPILAERPAAKLLRAAQILARAVSTLAKSPALAPARTFGARLPGPGAAGPAARGIEPLDIAPRRSPAAPAPRGRGRPRATAGSARPVLLKRCWVALSRYCTPCRWAGSCCHWPLLFAGPRCLWICVPLRGDVRRCSRSS